MADQETDTSSQERSLNTPDGASASFVKDRYTKAVKSIRRKTQEYWLNHAFLEGDQWLYWNHETRRLDNVPRDPDRVQATIDRIGPSSRTIMSKLVSRELRFEVPPTAADDASIQAAYTSESIIAATYEEHGWERLREDAMWAVWKGGSVAISVDWDPTLGSPLGVSRATGREFGTGDTVETVLAITEFVVEPGTRDAEKARWWIKVLALPPEEVQATYKLKEKPKSDATSGMSPTQARLLASALGSTGAETPELTLVYTYYERPNGKSKDGRIMTVVGDTVVDGPHPWNFPFKDRLNFVLLRESVVDGRWFGDTVLSKARPVQVAYNAAWSSIIEHMKLAGNARLMVPLTSMDLMEEASDTPGEIIPIAEGAPAFLSPPQMPQWWIEMPDRLGTQMDDILGVHDVSRGVTPANVQSGVGLSILSENDNTPTGRLVSDTARAFGNLATMVLRVYADNVKETRKAVVRVPGYPPETVQWSGKDLLEETRVLVPTDAIVPRSRAAMQQMAQKMMELGLIKSFVQFAELADLPDQHTMVEAVEPDVAKARRENHELALGRVVVPDEFDDDAKHIEQHNNFRKSPRYQLLDDKQKKICALHVQAHSTQQAEKLGQQQGYMQASPMLGASTPANGIPSLGMPPGGIPGAGAGATGGVSTPSGGSDVPPTPEAPPA